MKVSVIIPIHNKEKYLKNCLESLIRQNFQRLEIIIVDDGSNKNTKYKIQNIKYQLVDKNKNLKFINQKHQGVAKARNLGAKTATGDILVFVDADMVFDKNFIKYLIKPIESGETKGTFSKEEYVANWDKVWARCWNYNLCLPPRKRLPENYPDEAPVFRAILKSEFLKVGGFEPKGYADDWTLSKKLGYLATVARGAVYFHYNPETLVEVFNQARWRTKREYRLGLTGELLTLISYLLPLSLMIGIWKIIQLGEPRFLIFKFIFDFASFLGLTELIILRKYY